MSRSFKGIPLNQLKGSLTSFPTMLCGQKGKCIPIAIDWSLYNASSTKQNQAIIFSLDGNAAGPLLDAIRSVYIDNTNSNVPIYVYFPDTGMSVTCAANAEVWAAVYTNGKNVWIIGEGFVTGAIPSTFVIFTNIFVQPFTNYELQNSLSFLRQSSETVSPLNDTLNAIYGPASLGDQYFETSLSIDAVNNIFIPVFERNSLLFITQFQASMFGANSLPNINGAFNWSFNGTDSGKIFSGTATAVSTNGCDMLCDMHGNFKFTSFPLQTFFVAVDVPVVNSLAVIIFRFAYTLSAIN